MPAPEAKNFVASYILVLWFGDIGLRYNNFNFNLLLALLWL
jgi:hypothetical protein